MSKILIIEDEIAIAELEKDYLEMNDFEVDIATDGKTGLKMALDGSYDLFILDLMLPGLDGFAICKRIREDQDTPILMVSARKEDIDKVRGFGLGADDYITKPFSPSELVARAKGHLQRYSRLAGGLPSEKKSNILQIRGLKLDKTERIVWVDGKEVAFTQKEFELLEYLMEHPNQAFTRDELFRQIWEQESMGESSTVTVHVKRIRKKIEMDLNRPQYIETVWGVGYRFKV